MSYRQRPFGSNMNGSAQGWKFNKAKKKNHQNQQFNQASTSSQNTSYFSKFYEDSQVHIMNPYNTPAFSNNQQQLPFNNNQQQFNSNQQPFNNIQQPFSDIQQQQMYNQQLQAIYHQTYSSQSFGSAAPTNQKTYQPVNSFAGAKRNKRKTKRKFQNSRTPEIEADDNTITPAEVWINTYIGNYVTKLKDKFLVEPYFLALTVFGEKIMKECIRDSMSEFIAGKSIDDSARLMRQFRSAYPYLSTETFFRECIEQGEILKRQMSKGNNDDTPDSKRPKRSLDGNEMSQGPMKFQAQQQKIQSNEQQNYKPFDKDLNSIRKNNSQNLSRKNDAPMQETRMPNQIQHKDSSNLAYFKLKQKNFDLKQQSNQTEQQTLQQKQQKMKRNQKSKSTVDNFGVTSAMMNKCLNVILDKIEEKDETPIEDIINQLDDKHKSVLRRLVNNVPSYKEFIMNLLLNEDVKDEYNAKDVKEYNIKMIMENPMHLMELKSILEELKMYDVKRADRHDYIGNACGFSSYVNLIAEPREINGGLAFMMPDIKIRKLKKAQLNVDGTHTHINVKMDRIVETSSEVNDNEKNDKSIDTSSEVKDNDENDSLGDSIDQALIIEDVAGSIEEICQSINEPCSNLSGSEL